MNFFGELKRRNVYKVAITYAVVAWLLVQAASILLPTFEAPTWVMKALVVFLALGFGLVVFISWAFEATPEGLKRTENVPPDVAAALPTWSPRKFATFIVAVAVIAAALLAFNLFRTKPASPPTTAAPINNKSIAVLPFVNMSSDKEQDYFSDGLSEELLNQLARIPQLRVITRTSSFSFKGKEVDVATIAKALNVANVLEGSVRKSANTLRVTAQLIRASDSSHLWSHTYDRDRTDIFKVQDEIASDVVAALKVKLLPTQELPKAQRTNNPEAYQQYLQGRYHLNRFSIADFEKARAFLERACQLDPTFPLAWATLSRLANLETGWAD